MLDALGYHVHLPRAERDGAIAKLNVQHAFQHEKEIVGVFVLVPDKFALHLHDHDVTIVELCHRAGRPVLGKCG